jgi:hypothetical protein
MNFSEIPENPLIFLSWVTAIGLFISLSEATIKIKLEKKNSYRKRLELISSQLPPISENAAMYDKNIGNGRCKGLTKASAKFSIFANFS